MMYTQYVKYKSTGKQIWNAWVHKEVKTKVISSETAAGFFWVLELFLSEKHNLMWDMEMISAII